MYCGPRPLTAGIGQGKKSPPESAPGKPGQGVRVFIEKKAQLTLLGTEMDYVEDKLSSEFVFNNPNIKGTCGCGESFNI
ncbi:Iron-sulfur cluster assembly 1 homolog, mitochondrial [Lemmus lemmus]